MRAGRLLAAGAVAMGCTVMTSPVSIAQDYVGAPPGQGGQTAPPPGSGPGGDEEGSDHGSHEGSGPADEGTSHDDPDGGDYVGLAPEEGGGDDYVGVDLAGAAGRLGPLVPDRAPGAMASRAPVPSGPPGGPERSVSGVPISASDAAILAGLAAAAVAIVGLRTRALPK